MTKQEFLDLNASLGIQYLAVAADEITMKSPYRPGAITISPRDVEGLQKDEWEMLLKGEREVVEVYTVTRIIGYYSNTANWNKSKLGELDDRRRGDYDLEEPGDNE